MKLIRRILTLALAVLMVLSLGTTALAAEQTYTSSDTLSLIPKNNVGAGTKDITYAKSFINIRKVFDGLTSASEIPDKYSLTVSPESGGVPYVLDKNTATKSADGLTWTLEVQNAPAGKYNVSEEYYLIDGYEWSGTGLGKSIELNEAEFTISGDVITPDKLEYDVMVDDSGNNTIFVVSINGSQKRNVILSYYPLPQNVIDRIAEYLDTKAFGGKDFYNIAFSQNPSDHYDIVDGKGLTINREKNKVILDDDGDYNMVASLSYDIDTVTAEVDVKNSYVPSNTSLTVKKVWDDEGYASNRPTDLQVQLWQRSSKYPDVKDVAYGEPVTIDPTVENWQHTFSDLPLTNDAGDAVTYYVTELNVPDHYTPSIGEIGKDEDGNDTITITNTIDFAGVIIEKQVNGNMGDVNKEFNFTVTSTLPIGSVGAGGTLSEDHLTATFVLKDDGTIKLSGIPDGAVLTIKETNADGYTMKINGETYVPGTGYEYTVETDGNDLTEFKIVVTNEKEVLVDTGIFLDSLPYVLILGVVVVGFLFLRKRRHDDD